MAHLLPLVQAANISELLLVVDGKVSALPKTRQFVVPNMVGWLKPRAIIRSVWAVVVSVQEKPEVVMAYSFFPPGVFGLLAARLVGAAAILQLPGGPLEIESGGWVSDGVHLPVIFRRRLVALCHTLCSHFDAVIVRGGKAEAYVRQHSRPGQVQIMPGTVDSNRYGRNGDSRTVDIAFIGRIVPIKQPYHVCEVVRRVVQSHPSLRVVVAGRGPMLENMKQQARHLGLEDVIRFVGHVERVEGLLSRSRVFLLTSRSEGLSIALAEAMTAGAVPVVADVGDLSELVINGQTGWLIEPGRFDAYADRISALLDDRQTWLRMSANARQLALRNNGLDVVARRWEKLLELTMARHRLQSDDLLARVQAGDRESHETASAVPASRAEKWVKRPSSGEEQQPDTAMVNEIHTPGLQARPPAEPSSGSTPVPDRNSATVFFSGTGEPHAIQYDNKATFRDRFNLFVKSVQRTTPLPGKVLDFGCGPGNISLALAQLGYQVLGLDGASGMISVSRARSIGFQVPGLKFEQVDAEHFDPSVGPFDAVVCSSVLEYIEDDFGLLKKLIASLRPGGHLFVSVPHKANVFAPLEPLAHYVKLRLSGKTEGHLAHTLHHYTRMTFLRHLRDLGLQDLHCTSFECPVFGSLGIKLSRWSLFGRMFLFEGSKKTSTEERPRNLHYEGQSSREAKGETAQV